MMLEGYTQKLAGTGSNGIMLIGDVQLPTNINDSDLFPAMRSPPTPHTGATEMMFFRIRCHVADFLKRFTNGNTTFDGLWNKLTTVAASPESKDQAIDDLEALFDAEYLRYCDVSIPWHAMCFQLGKAIVAMMRFLAHSSGYYSAPMSQSQKDALFRLALQVISSQNEAYDRPEMRGFKWHVDLQFQWKAFIFIVSELRYRTTGEEVERAWREVEKAYTWHPSFRKELVRRALPVAVGGLTLKAWEGYVAARGGCVEEPEFVGMIRRRGTRREGNVETKDQAMGENVSEVQTQLEWSAPGLGIVGEGNESMQDAIPLDMPEHLDWTNWNDLFVDFQDTSTEEVPLDLEGFGFKVQ
jgi:hypothetical protein